MQWANTTCTNSYVSLKCNFPSNVTALPFFNIYAWNAMAWFGKFIMLSDATSEMYPIFTLSTAIILSQQLPLRITPTSAFSRTVQGPWKKLINWQVDKLISPTPSPNNSQNLPFFLNFSRKERPKTRFPSKLFQEKFLPNSFFNTS